MSENSNTKLNVKQGAIVLGVTLAALIFGRILAGMLVPLLPDNYYGQMNAFRKEIMTCIIWIASISVLTFFTKKITGVNLLVNGETRGKELPTKRLLTVLGIVIVCIVFISAQINFEVKPFHDLGVKFTGYELLGNLGGILRNLIKLYMMVIIMQCGQVFGEKLCKVPGIPWGGLLLMMTIGIYDIACDMTTLTITYLVLNLIFGEIFLLTEKSYSKTYIAMMMIYIF